MQQNTSKIHYPWLDVVRFIAALMVVYGHSRNDFFLPYGELDVSQQTPFCIAFYALGRLAHEAVVVFFVLSGFLVGGNGIKRIFDGSFDLKNYTIDRCVRIYLPLVASILLFLVTCILLGQPFDWLCALGNLLNLQESIVEPLVGPYWSLAYEMWFYISVAAFYLILRNTRWKWVGMGLMGFIGVVFVCGLDFFYFFLWLLGAFAFLTLPKDGKKWLLFLSFIIIIIGATLTQILSESHSVTINIAGISNYKLAELILAIGICIFIQQVLHFPPKRRFWIGFERIVGSMAQFSYTLYLSHRIIFLLLFASFFTQGEGQFVKNDLLLYIVFFVATVFLCWVFYLFTERYTSQLKKYIKSKI